MQVRGLPRQIIRNGRAAARLLAAKTPNIEAERRRAAVARWRRAVSDGLTAEAAARAVGVPRSTLYRWEKDATPKSRRPRRVRPRTWTSELRQAVERLRQDFPMWGRAKLGPLVRAEGFAVSDATVGRIIADPAAHGVVEPGPALPPTPADGRPSAAPPSACCATSPSASPAASSARHRLRQSRPEQGDQALHGLRTRSPNGPRPSTAPPPRPPPSRSCRREAHK